MKNKKHQTLQSIKKEQSDTKKHKKERRANANQIIEEHKREKNLSISKQDAQKAFIEVAVTEEELG